MKRLIRSIPACVSAFALILPLSTAQADEKQGGDVDIPAPRSAPAPAPRAEKPVASAPAPFIKLESRSLAALVGVSWGKGTLSFAGQEHAFSLRGLSLGHIGVSLTDGLGDVYNLETLEDFEGTYVAVEIAAAAGIGASTTRMRNENGVAIELRADLLGVELALATQGFSIRLR